MTQYSLRTPAVLINKATALRNLDRMQAAANASGVRLRPHTKTHKSPVVARWQLDRGAVGICCAKLGEAEVFADAGFSDIRLPYPINPANADRVLALLDRTRLSFIVDHPKVAEQWSDAMTRAGRSVDILVKVDVGFHRCGIDPDTRDTLPIITGIASLKGLNFKGLLSHAGQTYHAHSEDELRTMALAEARCMGDIAERCKKAGLDVEEVSAGATPPARFSIAHKEFTEYRPGNYVYFDRTQVALGAATTDDCALTVMATVVSKPAKDRVILDSGSKTLTNDGARGFTPAPGFGQVIGHDNLTIERLSEEHATVKVTGTTPLEPGDRVRIIPNHSCVVSNLVDQAWLVDGEMVEPLPIAARGRIA
ncbi:MAG TPA: alanine racemase [Vicinamibacterales bacterium]|nr:alanine racemase [Vicinamibacterales bacterium]